MRSYIHELREIARKAIKSRVQNPKDALREMLEILDPANDPRPPLAMGVMYVVRELQLIKYLGGDTLKDAIKFIKLQRDTKWDRPGEEAELQLINQFIESMLNYLENGNVETQKNRDAVHQGDSAGPEGPV